VALFRTASGVPVALEDRCGHRAAPFSAGGECIGEIMRCPYHGLEFDARGQCTRIPGQDRIPSILDVASYTVVEKDQLVWLWPGDPAGADTNAIVSHPYHGDPAWAWRGGMLEVGANFRLIVDNLLDLSHLQYVHRGTIGGDPDEESRAELKVRREGSTVYVRRWVRNVTPSPIHRLAKGYDCKLDRWQEIECRPGVLQFHSGAAPANSGALEEGRRDHAMHIRHFHGVTPSTETSTLYFFSSARNFSVDDEEVGEKMFASTVNTFSQDKVILEAQQRRILQAPERPLLTIRTDTGIVFARRIFEELIQAESRGDEQRPAADAVLLGRGLTEVAQA
jgi:vanillate O-demethylase monooxygenase subunit